MPDPAKPGTALTVLDVTWEPRVVHGSSSWLHHAVFGCRSLVLVTTATVPGVRHLEAVLHLMEEHHTPVVVIRGGQRRGRWPAPIEREAGRRTRALRQAGRLVSFPDNRSLAITGLDANPLPAPVVTAGATILRLAQPDAGTPSHTQEKF